MKLELKHLAPYLPYGLKLIGDIDNNPIDKYDISTDGWLCYITNNGGGKGRISGYKPILRPLSDLTKEIEINGNKFVPFS